MTPSARDYVALATQYARDVVSGAIPAAKWTRLACERQLRDLARVEQPDFPYRFDSAKAARICRFVELLPHIKGKWAGKPIRLESWQVFQLTTVFGWVTTTDETNAAGEVIRAAGCRRFRTAYIEVPRKNAKSTLTSGVSLYMLTADGEGGAECYSAATTRDQARIVFADAQAMARKSPDFRSTFGVEVGAHNIAVPATASRFLPLSADGSTLDGLNIHLAAVDEFHAHKTRAVYDVLETGTGARTQSLIWAITTAGSDRAGVCYEVRTYVTKILDQVVADETVFGIIYTIDDADDWTDPTVWAKANPNYGISVFPDDLARLCRKAQETPSAVNNFLTKRLNVWVNADVAWMDMRAWDRCAELTLSLDEFVGQPCYIGLDLNTKVDLAAKMLLFFRDIERDGKLERHYYAFGRYYLPERAIEESRNSQYAGWERSGRIITTPGEITDYEYIKDDLRGDASRFEIREVPYDPFQATQLATGLLQEGFPMVEFRPTVLNFSEPMKELEALVLSGRFHHDGCPVLAWMASNVVAHYDKKGNIFPNKERPENKIDGIVALISALGRGMVHQGSDRSTYEEEGLFTL